MNSSICTPTLLDNASQGPPIQPILTAVFGVLGIALALIMLITGCMQLRHARGQGQLTSNARQAPEVQNDTQGTGGPGSYFTTLARQVGWRRQLDIGDLRDRGQEAV